MALQLEYTTKHGFVCENAYLKINYLSGLKDYSISVVIYKDAEARHSDKEIIGQEIYNFTYSFNSLDNVIKQAYDYLKTLPEYINTVDC